MAETIANPIPSLLSERAQRSGPARLGNPRDSASRISFLAGFPDPGSLPKSDIVESTRVALEKDGEWALQYGSARGYPGLIEELVKKLGRDQGIQATPDNILITNGASQALALIVDLLVDAGDIVLSEAPTWSGAVHNFRAAGAEVRTVPIDANGLAVDALERELEQLAANGKRAKLLYFIPNFQNPTGVTTTLERRQRIAALAREHALPIVEDDAYFDLRYSGDFLPSLYSLDQSGRVMYMGTFSKTIGAGLRLGWVVIDPGPLSRSDALARAGRAAVGIAMGLVGVLLLSGVIEAFVTPSGLPTWARIAIGVAAEVVFLVYVWVYG
ncbi:MAG: PLP-dependent aminotransferase family protein, partial [Candidatus Limnocylindria bacterium]